MAGVVEQGGKGKLDVDLNLVPFIDLLSTLVLFLLLTAVWVRIAAIPASVDSKGKSAVSASDSSKLRVTVKRGVVQLDWPPSLSSRALPRSVASMDQLAKTFEKLVKEGVSVPASVGGDDQVEYAAVIQALDDLKSFGVTNIALSTE